MLSPKAPIFLALDPSKRGKLDNGGLKERAVWRYDVPLASVSSQQGPRTEGVTAFTDRVKREFARLFGAEEENVTVTIQIKG